MRKQRLIAAVLFVVFSACSIAGPSERGTFGENDAPTVVETAPVPTSR